MEVDVQDVAERSRYEAYADGRRVAVAEYLTEPGVRVFTHTVVDDDMEGQGIGGALARAALDDARASHLDVVPRCPSIADWIERHPDYADLVAG